MRQSGGTLARSAPLSVGLAMEGIGGAAPLLLSVGSAFFAAVANVLAKYVVGFARTRDYISVNFAILGLLLLPFTPLFFQWELTGWGVGLVVGAALVDGVANYLYFLAFEREDVTTASALLALAPLFALLFLPLFEPSALSTLGRNDLLGVLVIVVGIVVVNRGMTPETTVEMPRPGWGVARLAVPLGASILFGANVYPVKWILAGEIANPYTYYAVRAWIIAGMMTLLLRPHLGWVSRQNLTVVGVRALFVLAQWLLFLYALQHGDPPLVKAVSETSPLFVIGLSVLMLGAPLNRFAVGGAGLIVLGLLLLGV